MYPNQIAYLNNDVQSKFNFLFKVLILSLFIFGWNSNNVYACLAKTGKLNVVNSHIQWTGNPVILSAIPAGGNVIPGGYLTTYVLTEGPNLVIQKTAAFPSFNVAMQGSYRIHILIYNPSTLDLSIVVPGVTTGFDINALLIQGGGSICGALDVAGAKILVSTCLADAGTLTIDNPIVQSQTGTGTVMALPDGNSNVPIGYQAMFLLTSSPGLAIQQTSSQPQFTVSQYGDYNIHTFIFDPATYDLSTIIPFQTTAVDIANNLSPNGGTICGSIDVVGAGVTVAECGVFAGTVTMGSPIYYLVNGMAEITAVSDGNALISNGYETTYLLSSSSNVIEQVNTIPKFTVNQVDNYRIHAFLYDPNTFNLASIIPNNTTTIDVFYQTYAGGGLICADLDVIGGVSLVKECDADAGTLTAWEAVTLFNGSQAIVSGLPDGNTNVPAGFQLKFILTEGPNKVLQQTSNFPSFVVDTTGVYHIHTLVYNPLTFDQAFLIPGVTTGYHLDIYLIQGGGAICGSFDLTGTQTIVTECPAFAGTILIDQPKVPFLNGTANISATPLGNAIVPPGFQTVYVLTTGPQNYTILQTSTNPGFTTTQTGNYVIHTLVYDPTTLNLATIVPGITSALAINSQLVQGGGTICGSLDVVGASVSVFDCIADAGTISADSTNIILVNGSTVLSATPTGNAVVPQGYLTTYLLTSGAGLVIEQGNNIPVFTVTQNESYTIHTLVYDPVTFDLAIIVPGITTGFDVNAMLIQGGGTTCAALDVAGAPIVVADCLADAGSITIDNAIVLLKSGSATVTATPDGNSFVPTGYQITYVLTEGAGLVIYQGNSIPVFTVNLVGNYTIHTLVHNTATLDLSVIVPGVTTGFDINALLQQGGGGICGSLDVTGAPVQVTTCEAFAGTSTAVNSNIIFNGTAATVAATPDGNVNIPPGYQLTYLLTEGSGLVVQVIYSLPSFVVTSVGNYSIHAFVYNPVTYNLSTIFPGVTTAGDINARITQGGGNICASLDVVGAPIKVSLCEAEAGTLTANDSIVTLSGPSVPIGANPDGNAVVTPGYLSEFILTKGPGLIIEQTSATFPLFTVTQAGDYTIHTLIYDPATLDLSTIILGTTTGFDINALLIQGGGSLCGSLDVLGAPIQVITPTSCLAEAGTLQINDAAVEIINGFAVVAATPGGNTIVPQGYQITYVLTESPSTIILQTSNSPSFSVTAVGNYTLHTLVYDPNTLDLSTIVFGTTTALDVNSLLIQGGGTICAALDLTGAPVNVSICPADAGTITSAQDTVLLFNGANNVIANPDGNEVIPPQYESLYLLSQGTSKVILQTSNLLPIFTVTQPDKYAIHTLVFNPLTFNTSLIVNGTTTVSDIESQFLQGGGAICGSIDTIGAEVVAIYPNCPVEAGSITANQSTVVLSSGTASIGATLDGNQVVPSGYQITYLLSNGPGLIIEQVNTAALFTVSTSGNYIIHTLVYDPTTYNPTTIVLGTTTVNTVEMMFIQGGGTICASADLQGAAVVVNNPAPCTADAGTLTAGQSPVVISGGSASVNATPDGNQVIPTGYQQIALLTSNGVVQAGNNIPQFTVNAAGSYSIHLLIYDQTTFDITTIVLGTTTINDISLQLIQGGGTICGSIDLQGAAIVVNSPVCTADAGSITPTQSPVVSSGGTATISAVPDGNQVVPTGYQMAHVLTKGAGLVIEQLNTSASFTVNAAGSFVIHTLIFDPNTLDLSTIIAGTTTAFDVEVQLLQGGGSICGSLDMQGAAIIVNVPSSCLATAGTMTINQSPIVLVGAAANVGATPDGNAVIPSGFQSLFLLSSSPNATIEQTGTSLPIFSVSAAGDYAIHTLVYNPSTFNPATIANGTTTIGDLDIQFIQGGGSICGSLDIGGASVIVTSCNANAGTITANQSQVVLSGAAVAIEGTPNGNQTVPSGFQTAYVLTKGAAFVIEQISTFNSVFTVTSTGNYAIHTLVFDPNTLNLSTIVLGTTTANDVDALLIQGGGSICGALDMTGAPVTVVPLCNADAGTITIVKSQVTLSGGTAVVEATLDGNAVVPSGFQTLYLLSKGTNLVIKQTGAMPMFTVDSVGSYIIHTLVYDPGTFNPSTIILGSTTGASIANLLIQGGGSICGSLDVPGAGVTVTECVASAGTLTANATTVILNGSANIGATPDGNTVVPPGFFTWYVLTSGSNQVVEQTSSFNSLFTVSQLGLYTIHSIVFNPNTYNPNVMITPGVTTGFDINAAFLSGGGSICGDFDQVGAEINVVTPLQLNINVLLEGAVNLSQKNNHKQLMNTNLADKQLLPNQSTANSMTSITNSYYDAPYHYKGTALENSFGGGNYPPNAVDWVLVTLQSDIAGTTIIGQGLGLLLNDGTVDMVDPLPELEPQQQLQGVYIKVDHRNHMAVLSTVPVSIINGALSWNFSTQQSYTGHHGVGAKEVLPGVFALYAGDGDQVGDIVSYDVNGADKALWHAENGVFNQYSNADYNLDGDVNGADVLLWQNNKGYSSRVPK